MAIDEMKQTAKEMFEELGLTWVKEYPDGTIAYSTPCGNCGVTFYTHTVCAEDLLDMDMLKAIFKQCQELGWIE